MNTVGSARRKEAMHALNPFAPGAGRQPKELVGREQELEIMDRIIARTKAGYSDRGLVYSGLRGVGKTVLLLRMKDMAASQGLITVRMEATGNEAHDYELLFGGISKAILRERRGTLRQKMLDSLKHVNEVSLELGVIKTSIGLGNEGKGISSDSLRLEMMVEELCRELKKEGSGLFLFIDCLCSISCCGFSHDDFSGLGRACRPRNGLNWMVLVSPPERTGKDYDQHAPSTVYPSFAAERGIRRVDRAENTCQRADGA